MSLLSELLVFLLAAIARVTDAGVSSGGSVDFSACGNDCVSAG